MYSLLLALEILDHEVNSSDMETKRNHCMPNQNHDGWYFNQSNIELLSCLGQFVRARIVTVNTDVALLIVFSYCSKDFWQTNGCVPCIIYSCNILKWHYSHMFIFLKETGDRLPRNASHVNNFYWVWLSLKSNVICFRLIRTHPVFDNCAGVIYGYYHITIVYLSISLHQSIQTFFRVIIKLYRNNANKSFSH